MSFFYVNTLVCLFLLFAVSEDSHKHKGVRKPALHAHNHRGTIFFAVLYIM